MVRLRNRYIVVEVVFDTRKKNSTLRAHSLMDALNKSIRDLHGIQGVGLCKAGLMASYLNRETSIAFVRMRRSAYKLVVSAMTLINRLDDELCSLKTLYTGATIKQCNVFLRRYHRRELEQQFASLKSEAQIKQLELHAGKCLSITSAWR